MYAFSVLKFFLFIFLNFVFIFQFFFSFNFFFSSVIDEEFVICLAIFFVFILFINQIVHGLQEMLKAKIDMYFNIFLLLFKLLKKGLRRLKKHNIKTISTKLNLYSFLFHIFLKNLSSLFEYQNSLFVYLLNFRLRVISELVLIDFELRDFLQRKFFMESFFVELEYLLSLKFLTKI
jgi:hypothetical protein